MRMKVLSINFKPRCGYGDSYSSDVAVILDDSVDIREIIRIIEIAAKIDPSSGPQDPDYWSPSVTIKAIKKALGQVANINVVNTVKWATAFIETKPQWITDDQKAEMVAEMRGCIRKIASTAKAASVNPKEKSNKRRN